MYTNQIFATFAALLTIARALPLNHRRDLVIVTKTQEVIVTVPVTRTVWFGEGASAPTVAAVTSEQSVPSPVTSHFSAPSPIIASSPEAAPTPTVVVPVSSSAPAPAPVSSIISSIVAHAVSPVSVVAVQPATTSPIAIPSPTYTSSSSSSSSSIAPTIAAPAPTGNVTPSSSESTGETAVDKITSGPAAAGQSYVGDLTYYAPGLGACGITNTESQHIVAVSETIFDVYTPGGNPNANPLCGQWVEITGVDGQVYPAQITDRCVGCAAGSLDLTEDFFNEVTNNGDGRVHNIHWQFAGAA